MYLYLGRHAFVLYRLTHSRNLALADSLNIAFNGPATYHQNVVEILPYIAEGFPST